MPIPAKDAVIEALNRFSRALHATTDDYRQRAEAQTVNERIIDIAETASDAAKRLSDSGTDALMPTIADSLRYLTVAVKEIADELSDPDHARNLKIPAVELMNFVLRHAPVMTIEGMEFSDRSDSSA